MDRAMKKERGFTLVELMVVVSITVLLLAWGLPAYSTWKQKHDIENQMVQLYSDLQFARMTAYCTKEISGVLWSNNFQTYQIMSDTQGNGTIDTGAFMVNGTSAVTLNKHPVTQNTSPPAAGQISVSFDGRGFLYTTNAPDVAGQITYYVASSYGAGMNCVQVSTTQIILGKWNGQLQLCAQK
jgi:prepilin-type N-terminal cleavage/methylation domain-containing protein